MTERARTVNVMTTTHQIYEGMQRIAPLELAESWDNPGLLVDCGGPVEKSAGHAGHHPGGGGGGRRQGLLPHRGAPPGHLQPAQKAGQQGCALPVGAERRFRHLYAHQSGRSRGRRQRGAGGHFRDAELGDLCGRLRPCGRDRPHHGAPTGEKRPSRSWPSGAICPPRVRLFR